VNKIELVDSVLQGDTVPRAPLSLWYHFGVQHGEGARFARLALSYFHYYDFDFLKVMNDYFYPMPEGLTSVRTGSELQRLTRFAAYESPWLEQFRALEVIDKELKGIACFIDTVFDPWHTLKRSLAGENIDTLMDREPDAMLGALDVITENLIAYCLRSLDIGSAGIFLSVPASREFMSREQFLTFVKPFAYRIFEAVSGRGRMNVAHIHGEDLFFDDCPGCVMGGIDHNIVSRRTRPFLKDHVREGRMLGGKNRFFLANGCSIDTSVNPKAIQAIVEAAREPL
jgi:uroporphyrinogen decarboxylase